MAFCEMGRERYKCCETVEGEPGCVQVHACCQERVRTGKKEDLLTGRYGVLQHILGLGLDRNKIPF